MTDGLSQISPNYFTVLNEKTGYDNFLMVQTYNTKYSIIGDNLFISVCDIASRNCKKKITGQFRGSEIQGQGYDSYEKKQTSIAARYDVRVIP